MKQSNPILDLLCAGHAVRFVPRDPEMRRAYSEAVPRLQPQLPFDQAQ